VTPESTLVVDTNVAVKWFVPEPMSDRAAILLHSGVRMIAPSVIEVEFGNVMRKKLRQQEVTAGEAGRALESLASLVDLRSADGLLAEAWAITVRYNPSFSDALFFALAIWEGCRLVTADEKLINGLGARFRDRFLRLSEI
jgi:predicted nucleic acid-binding protein